MFFKKIIRDSSLATKEIKDKIKKKEHNKIFLFYLSFNKQVNLSV